jgi:hypothetical protein
MNKDKRFSFVQYVPFIILFLIFLRVTWSNVGYDFGPHGSNLSKAVIVRDVVLVILTLALGSFAIYGLVTRKNVYSSPTKTGNIGSPQHRKIIGLSILILALSIIVAFILFALWLLYKSY